MNWINRFLNCIDILKARERELLLKGDHFKTSDPEIVMVQKLLYELKDPEVMESYNQNFKSKAYLIGQAYNFLKGIPIERDIDIEKLLGVANDD